MSETPKVSAERKRLRMWYAVLVIAVAAILAFSMLSVVFYRQAKDYHDAKYRAQFVIISDIRQRSSDAGAYVGTLTSTGEPLESREVAGFGAVLVLEDLSDLVWAVQEMYLTDSEKNLTFSTLRQAVDTLRSNAETVLVSLQMNRTYDIPREENLTLNAEISTAGALLASLAPIIDRGFEFGVDFEKHPYSIVNRLDLQTIKSIANSMIDSF